MGILRWQRQIFHGREQESKPGYFVEQFGDI